MTASDDLTLARAVAAKLRRLHTDGDLVAARTALPIAAATIDGLCAELAQCAEMQALIAQAESDAAEFAVEMGVGR